MKISQIEIRFVEFNVKIGQIEAKFVEYEVKFVEFEAKMIEFSTTNSRICKKKYAEFNAN